MDTATTATTATKATKAIKVTKADKATKKATKRDGHINLINKAESGELKVVFQGEKMDPSFVNALRRVLMSEIKAFSLMGNHMIMSNSSQVFKNNEFLISRISLIPIYVEDESIDKMELNSKKLEFCICDNDDKNKPLINLGDEDLVISSYSFQIYEKDTGNRSKLRVEDMIKYDYPILKLRKGEEFHYKGEIAAGCGYYHATWKGCRVTYKFENDASMMELMGNKKSLEFQRSEITGKILETNETKRNFEKNELGNPEHISLTLRSVGHYNEEYCFRLALDTLEEKLLILENMVENPRQMKNQVTRVEIIPNGSIENYVQVKIQDLEPSMQFLASHTLGNLIESYMYNRVVKKVGGNLEEIRQTLSNYKMPHPLDKIIYLHIKVPPGYYDKKGNTDDKCIKLLLETIAELKDVIGELRNEFIKY
jgi:DNA-directed RNA polymerase alpha subunit